MPSLEQPKGTPANSVKARMRALAFGQQRLWFIDQLYPNTAAYSLPFTTRLKGTLDVSALERAFRALVERHEILRTIIVGRDGIPVGLLLQDNFFEFKTFDIRGGTGSESSARQLLLQEAQRPFHLGRGPLFRVTLVRFEDNSYLLLHNVPHSSFDGGSIGVMYKAVEQLYRRARGEEVVLPELPIQFSQYAAWQQQELQTHHDRLMTYWMEQLSGAQSIHMPYDRPRPAVKSLRGGRYRWALAPDLLPAAIDFFGRQKVSHFRGFYAALNVLLHCYTGSWDILVSSPVSTPRPPGAEQLLGLFVNTVVFRTRFTENCSFREILSIVGKTVREGVNHAALEFDRIIAALNPPRDATSTPLVQLNFRVRTAPYPALQLPGVEGTRAEYLEAGTSKFDLALEIESSEGTAYFEYSSDLYDHETIVAMAGDYQTILAALVANPDIPLKDLEAVQRLRRLRMR